MSKIVSESENQIKQAVIWAFESAMEKGQLAAAVAEIKLLKD